MTFAVVSSHHCHDGRSDVHKLENQPDRSPVRSRPGTSIPARLLSMLPSVAKRRIPDFGKVPRLPMTSSRLLPTRHRGAVTGRDFAHTTRYCLSGLRLSGRSTRREADVAL